jgi:type VI secretion system secreted protein VgrG
LGASNAQFRLEGGPMPSDAQVARYEALEAVSRPFEVSVEFFTRDTSFVADALLRQPLLLTLVDENLGTRSFHGIVDAAEFSQARGEKFYFRVHLVPALAALAHREDCRIFQDKSIVEVITTIFTEAGFNADVQWQLKGTYSPQEFIVQYRESSLNFVSRLMEAEGIFYFFQHAPSGHTMVVSDDESAFVLTAGAPPVEFTMTQGALGQGVPLESFRRTRTVRTAALKVRDYDFVKPQVKPEGTQAKNDARPLFFFEYPGGFTKTADATRRATARMRMLRRDADVVHGASGAIGLRVGVPFMVDGVGEGNLVGKFIVTELTTRGHQTFEDDVGNRVCQNSFAAIPDGAVWAPPLLARKPRIRGVQTVVVTGPGTSSSESIHVDQYGRIKVHFFWDRVGQLDENASCWLRVTQAQMGGTMILPRVQWELSVAFLEGDPDRPFAIGRLYNAENTPPDGLPGAKASGSIKSMSSPGGAGHNEMKMSDSGGSQGHGMSAQKDLNVTIGNNKTETIAVNEDHSVTVNMSSSIKGNETVIVASNQAVDIGAVLSQNIGGNETIVVGGADTTNADSNLVEKITGNRDYSIGGMSFTMQNGIEHTVQGNLERDVSAVQLTASVGSISDNIVGGLTQKAGAVKVILAKGSVAESITGSKNQIAAAAEVHLIKGGYQASCDGSVTRLIGGLHQWNVSGDISIKGKMVTIGGATGTLSGGGSTIKLGGGPVLLQGSKVAVEAAMVVKLGGSMKLGPG